MSDGSGSGSITLHFIALTRTNGWLQSTARARRSALGDWGITVGKASGSTPHLVDDKGGLMRFTGNGEAILKVHEWAAAHRNSATVQP